RRIERFTREARMPNQHLGKTVHEESGPVRTQSEAGEAQTEAAVGREGERRGAPGHAAKTGAVVELPELASIHEASAGETRAGGRDIDFGDGGNRGRAPLEREPNAGLLTRPDDHPEPSDRLKA